MSILNPLEDVSLEGVLKLDIDTDTYAELALDSSENFNVRVMGCVIDTDSSADSATAYAEYIAAGGE